MDNLSCMTSDSPPNLEIPKGLRAFVSANNWSYIINGNGNALRMSFPQFGSCTPELFLQGYIIGLSEKKRRELSKRCDEAKDTMD